MNGDSADPIIADAYAMGVRNFDVGAALKYMVKGATQTESGHGLEIERQYLTQYLSQHYVNAGSLDLTSIDYSIGGSATLEYAIDDFAIAQIATAEHDRSLAVDHEPARRQLGVPVQPGDGLHPGPRRGRQLPSRHGLRGVTARAGRTDWASKRAMPCSTPGPSRRTWPPWPRSWEATLPPPPSSQAFMSSLNATRDVPEEWSGNEPDEWAPWEFDSFGAPDQTQRFVRAIADSEYADAPVDEPGNDDLGALSSWYVWAAIGLFPVTPGSADLALASPLFPSVTITLPDGRRLVEQAPGAAAARPYVHALTVTGVTHPAPAPPGAPGRPRRTPPAGTWNLPWLPASALSTGGTLRFTLSGTPDPGWASSPAPALLRSEPGSSRPWGSRCRAAATPSTAGQPTTIQIGMALGREEATTVHWQAVPDPERARRVSPSSGTLDAGSGRHGADRGAACTARSPPRQPLSVTRAGGRVLPAPGEPQHHRAASRSRPSSSTSRCSAERSDRRSQVRQAPGSTPCGRLPGLERLRVEVDDGQEVAETTEHRLDVAARIR